MRTHTGATGVDGHQALLRQALALLPAGVRVTVPGDSEFRNPALFAWVRQRGHHAILGIRGVSRVFGVAVPAEDGHPLQAYLADRPTVTYLSQVTVTAEHRYGPVNVMAWWDQSQVTQTQRLERLLIICLAYLWFVSVGRWMVKRGYRRQLDDRLARRWGYSLFQLGVAWKQHLQSYQQPFPLIWYIYV